MGAVGEAPRSPLSDERLPAGAGAGSWSSSSSTLRLPARSQICDAVCVRDDVLLPLVRMVRDEPAAPIGAASAGVARGSSNRPGGSNIPGGRKLGRHGGVGSWLALTSSDQTPSDQRLPVPVLLRV